MNSAELSANGRARFEPKTPMTETEKRTFAAWFDTIHYPERTVERVARDNSVSKSLVIKMHHARNALAKDWRRARVVLRGW